MLRKSLILFCALALASQTAAQSFPEIHPSDTVRSWYQRFLGRDPDRVGMRSWTDALRSGGDERDILAKILGGGEYYWRAGRSDEGFVTRLWTDLTGTDIDEQTKRETLQIVRAEGRERAARAMMELALTVNTGTESPSAEWREQVLRESERLNMSLENLAEDIVVELLWGEERRAYNDVERLLERLGDFQRLLRSAAPQVRQRDAFRAFDEELHAVVSNVPAIGSDRPALLLRVQDVLKADRRVHAIVFAGASQEADTQRWMARQSALVADELHELRRTSLYAMKDARGSEGLLLLLDDLCMSADELVASLDQPLTKEDLARQVAEISVRWGDAANAINELPPQGHYFLSRSAARVDRALDRLEDALQIESHRSYLYVR